jgi:signal transduction histidine kinase
VVQDTSLRAEIKTESRSYTKSSSFVMALLFTILCGAAAISLGYFINYFAKGHFIHSTEATIDAEIRYVEAKGPEQIQEQASDNRGLYLFLNEDGNLPNNIPSTISRLAEGIIIFDYPENGLRYAAKIHTLEDNRRILVGTDITTISKDFKFMQWLGIASILFVMIVVFVSYLISIFVVSGTNKIADTAREIIDTGDLSRRVDVGSRWDDLSNMTAILNMLLERIEELMQGVRQVSDNIAHDLRTPLTRLRSKLEMLKDDKTKTELLEEADHLLSTFNALLRISLIEAEKQRGQFSNINFKELLEDVIAFYEPLSEEKSINLAYSLSEASLRGDRNLLFQAYANLLDNALKFTPENGQITISLIQKDNQTHVEISDTGKGIPESDKDKIFNRLYRGEQNRNSSGAGLGLSLVRAVIKLHNGGIKVENLGPGLKIITSF